MAVLLSVASVPSWKRLCQRTHSFPLPSKHLSPFVCYRKVRKSKFACFVETTTTDLDERYSRDKCAAQIEHRDQSNDIESNKSSRSLLQRIPEICNVYRECVSFAIYTCFSKPDYFTRHSIRLDWYRLGEIGKRCEGQESSFVPLLLCSRSTVETPTRVIRSFTAPYLSSRPGNGNSNARSTLFSIIDISRKTRIFRSVLEQEYIFTAMQQRFMSFFYSLIVCFLTPRNSIWIFDQARVYRATVIGLLDIFHYQARLVTAESSNVQSLSSRFDRYQFSLPLEDLISSPVYGLICTRVQGGDRLARGNFAS